MQQVLSLHECVKAHGDIDIWRQNFTKEQVTKLINLPDASGFSAFALCAALGFKDHVRV